MLRVRERGGLPGAAAGDHPVDAALDLPLDQARERVLIDRAIASEGGYERGVGSLEAHAISRSSS